MCYSRAAAAATSPSTSPIRYKVEFPVGWFLWRAVVFFLFLLEIFKFNVTDAYNIYCLDFSSRYINIMKTDDRRQCYKTHKSMSVSTMCKDYSLRIFLTRFSGCAICWSIWIMNSRHGRVAYNFDWLMQARKSSFFFHWI